MAKAIVSTVKPNARETPSRPIPTSGKLAAITALPHPPKTSQNVPINSAPYFSLYSPCSLWFDSSLLQSWLVKYVGNVLE